MWRKVLVCIMALLGSCAFVYAYFQNQLSASVGATPTYSIGDTIYYAGNTYTYVGSDGANLLLLNNAAVASNQTWTNANTNAVNHKNNLGNIGKTIVNSELPTTTTLQQAAASSGGAWALNNSIPKITIDWWLGDTELQKRNLARFVSSQNKMDKSQSYQTYTKAVSGVCQTPSNATTAAGTAFINDFTSGGESNIASWTKSATYTYELTYTHSGTNRRLSRYGDSNCTGLLSSEASDNGNTIAVTATYNQSNYGEKPTFTGNYNVMAVLASLNLPYIPSNIGWSGTLTQNANICYITSLNHSNYKIQGIRKSANETINSSKVSGGTRNLRIKLTDVTVHETGNVSCSAVTTNGFHGAGSRPLVKVPMNQILYANSTKPTITT
ncbi:MAG: hypothetical protein HFE67_07810, partial [Erysipelotrichaceae bacterium]|nr:hypothetical protein [Erysipelotrichaceae bacterium]